MCGVFTDGESVEAQVGQLSRGCKKVFRAL
jgi:hypothetical protein